MNIFKIHMRMNLFWKDVYFLRVDDENKLVTEQGKANLEMSAALETVLLHREFHYSVHSIQTIKKHIFHRDKISKEDDIERKILASTFLFNYQQTIILLTVIYLVETMVLTMSTVSYMICLRYSVILTFMQIRWI